MSPLIFSAPSVPRTSSMKTTPFFFLMIGRTPRSPLFPYTPLFRSVAMSLNVSLIILDPLYSTHDQDENDIRAMAALALERKTTPLVSRPVLFSDPQPLFDLHLHAFIALPHLRRGLDEHQRHCHFVPVSLCLPSYSLPHLFHARAV